MTAVRVARPGDRAKIEALLRGESLPLDGIEDHFARFVVAEEAGEVLGAAGLEVHGDYGLLRSVVVARSAKGRGIGRAVTNRVLEDAKARGLRAVYLLTTIAANYFELLGFVRVAREEVPVSLEGSRELQGACPASAIVMRRA